MKRLTCLVLALAPLVCGAEPPASDDVVLRAMVDELDRSVKELALPGFPPPYYIQLNGQDRHTYGISAAYGGLQRSNESRNRSMSVRVRVGAYELDNTNFGRSGGQSGSLPLDDDYVALRQTIWLLLDQDYKQGIEGLTRKTAYLKEKSIDDRPDDFSPAPSASAMEPRGRIELDRALWEKNLQHLSERFKSQTRIQDSRVTLFAGSVTEWIVNSEGTRLRVGDTGVHIQIDAELQADDGMPLGDSLSYLGERVDQLPSMERMLADIDQMCGKLTALASAPMLEQYSGPVLFEPEAAGMALETLLGDRLCARPVPIGGGGDDQSFEKKIGLRILPRSFQVYDDPGPRDFEGKVLAGAYHYDDEAVRPARVNLVEKGILKTLVAGRAPTRKIKHSTGHGRNAGFGDPRANLGCLYVSDDNAMSTEELHQELVQTARDEGLEFALRVTGIEDGAGGELGDPIYAYKVSPADGKEELVRGLQFRNVEPMSMKRILAAGKERRVHNSFGGVSASVIAPAVLFEELELTKIKAEFDTLPILKSPATRGK